MHDKLAKAQQRYDDIEKQLADPEIASNHACYQKLAKEHSDLTPLIAAYREFQGVVRQLNDLSLLLKEKHEEELEKMAKTEIEALEEKRAEIEKRLEDFLNPVRQEKDRNVIIEIRAGTGGAEAGLFAADLFRMYAKYADAKGWNVESISSHESEAGGLKEAIFSISGKGASKRLKWESGVHRVQRVPTTEASGRIHTSAATVAVLFEPEEVELQIDPKDLKIDVFRSSGPGGQSVNTTDSAVRITHIPTGTVVVCQDERSQMKNKAKAMRVLRARLLDNMKKENLNRTTQERKAQVGTGDRSEKIRTYNFPDRRVTDHRIGFTTHRLENILNGELDEITEALMKAAQESLEK